MGRPGGTYALVLHLPSETSLQVGRLGCFVFPAGFYVYVGSALGGLAARVSRHLGRRRRTRWHVDYLLAAAEPLAVYALAGDERYECTLAGAVACLPAATLPVPRFGSSDCRCAAHLVGFPFPPELSGLLPGLVRVRLEDGALISI